MVLSEATNESEANDSIDSMFASRYVRVSLPRFKMPEHSIPKDAAYQIINDELMLDGNPRLNLASFVTTWMEPECDKLIMSSINKNYVDMDEYPVTTELQALLFLITSFSSIYNWVNVEKYIYTFIKCLQQHNASFLKV